MRSGRFGPILRPVIILLLLALPAGCATPLSETRTNHWTKEAYERVEPRLRLAKAGMPFDEFRALVDIKVTTSGGKVAAAAGDGWLSPAGNTWISGQTQINEQMFGYVDEGIQVKKAIVRFEDAKLVSIRFFEGRGLTDYPPEQRKKFHITNVSRLYSREAYLKAAERAKKLRLGMDVHEFEETMDLLGYMGENGWFYTLGQGFLVSWTYQTAPDPKGPHRLQRVFFGHMENNEPAAKIEVEFEDGKISFVKWL